MRNLVPIAVALAAAACGAPAGPAPAAIEAYAARKAAEGPAAPAAAGSPARPVRPAVNVKVTVVAGAGLPDTDGAGRTDPYVVLQHEGQRVETSVADGTLDPTWGDSFILDAWPGAALVVTLMDSDTGADDRVGVVSELLPELAPGESRELTLAFGEGGTVTLRLERP